MTGQGQYQIPKTRWVRDGSEWVAVCGPFYEFDYDAERFAEAIVEGHRRFAGRRTGLVQFGKGPRVSA